jgi:hypothetical protein
VSRVPLSDEETRVIFAAEAAKALGRRDAADQKAVITRLLNIVTSSAPPSSFVYERIANLDIIVVGDQGRLYTKVVDEIPRGNTEYHVIFVFYLDLSHDYPNRALAEYSSRAEQRAEAVTALETVDDVAEYLDERNALDVEDLRDLLP